MHTVPLNIQNIYLNITFPLDIYFWFLSIKNKVNNICVVFLSIFQIISIECFVRSKISLSWLFLIWSLKQHFKTSDDSSPSLYIIMVLILLVTFRKS